MYFKPCSLLIAFIFLFSSCSTNKIKVSSIAEPVNHYNNTPVVIQIDANKVSIGKYTRIDQSKFFRFYDQDCLGNREKEFIKKITLSNSNNIFERANIFLYIDKIAREYGGNFVHVREIFLGEKNGVTKNEVKMEIYKVGNISDLVQYHYWHKERELKPEDFENKSSSNDTLSENIVFEGLLTSERTGQLNIIYTNVFVRENSTCFPCNEIDILRENVKFDLIELIQRQQVQAQLLNNEKTNTKWSLNAPYPSYALIQSSLEEINDIQDVKVLNEMNIEINAEIEKLEKYSHKKVPLASRK